MLCIPLTDFVHNGLAATVGKPIEFPDGTAADLERAGLVRIKQGGEKAVAVGKPADDGQGQPSSSSPAAPASPIKTLTVSKRGAPPKGKKKGR